MPIHLSVAADNRLGPYRMCGFTSATVTRSCMVSLTARKYGLCVTASRSVSFGPMDDIYRKEHDAASKVSATYVAATWPDAVPQEILNAGKRIYQITGYEHEWRYCPQGHVTGRIPVELALTPKTEELFETDWAITWRASVGTSTSCDSYLVTEKGPHLITPCEAWPLRRIRFQGVEITRPFVLER